jgi:uroporphyrinogen-III synthase
MQLLVTRPQPQADEWVGALRAQRIDAVALPLIAIAPDGDAEVAAAWRAIDAWRLLVFVSPNAVSTFFTRRPRATAWPSHLQAACTGPGTARALRDVGVPPSQIVEPADDAAQFDSEALWQQLRGQAGPGQRVLVVRGDGGRDWLAERLRERGADVQFVQAYRRTLPMLDAPQHEHLQRALAAPAQHVWLFSSSQAVDHLRQLAAQAAWAVARAWATHPRIAETLHTAGFGAVRLVPPTIDAVVAAWRASIQSSAASDQRP